MKSLPLFFLSFSLITLTPATHAKSPSRSKTKIRFQELSPDKSTRRQDLRASQGWTQSQLKELTEIVDHKGERIWDRFQTVLSSGNQPGLWSHLDPRADQIEGTSTQKLYQNLRLPPSDRTVIVAVIDSGIDIRHPDLEGKIWVNQAELRGQTGIDDDGNGYIDDIQGWNFLGNPNGQNVEGSTLELTREYARLKGRFERGELDPTEQKYFAQIKAEYETAKTETEAKLKKYTAIIEAFSLLRAEGLKEESVQAVSEFSPTSEDARIAKALALESLKIGITSVRAQSVAQSLQEAVEFHYNPDFEPSSIIGDDPANLVETGYGNNNVMAGDSAHGTHVAGIIAAIRDNQLGIDGHATQVKVMAIRAVPNGDERDKDVANAIRYAVDNGAKVVNMSFGKSYVFNKKVVDDAVLYAESRGVLLVHAAGNDSKNTESHENNFPNRRIKTKKDVIIEAKNWIEVGASDRSKQNEKLAARFSNYGKTSVDLFAPGVGIVSTVPDGKYARFNGTSMAAPQVAGVAAILIHAFPQATLAEIREAILSSVNQYGDLKTQVPGSTELCLFSELSIAGGTLNAYQGMLTLMSKLGLPAPVLGVNP